ncbi:hypothetical protein IGI04_020039 [Brassica rapa subsp. trilocularis]|uniref:Uncharacterized protein n=1 Tax=Brassica rapa subsp. trilocularis TaxID=1813537 RepID=A0ABQ7MII1_BRACM|nr:hypothetical protein IGI04_020039 [Brassica rapa subsp. trilocularis]
MLLANVKGRSVNLFVSFAILISYFFSAGVKRSLFSGHLLAGFLLRSSPRWLSLLLWCKAV